MPEEAGRHASRTTARRGAVTIMFATAIIPLAMSAGLAIDYSFYIQAQAQLALAADSGAIHAVRIASSHFVAGETAAAAGVDGATAGLQWFNAQMGVLVTGTVNATGISIPPVAYDPSTSTFTAAVTYNATIPTHFGPLFNAMLSWPLTGTANAVIVTNSYVRIEMLMDNSSSMLIGATPPDIEALQNLTICPPTAVATSSGHGGNGAEYGEYSWNFPSNQGFNLGSGQTAPTLSNKGGTCWTQFTGDTGGLFPGDIGECVDPVQLTGSVIATSNGFNTYLPAGIAQPVNANGYCPTGTGSPDTSLTNKLPNIDSITHLTRNLPQAPCGFACHGQNSTTDYYTVLQNARALGARITLRFDVIQSAAAQVVTTLLAKQQVPNQFSVGVFTFNSGVAQVHPAAGNPFVEADSNLSGAASDITTIATPAVADNPNTNFPGAMSYLASHLTAGGDGSTPTKPRKNLFIITDGLEDYSPSSRFIGQMTIPTSETICAPLKALGYNIYVLYTPYYPLPNPFYLTGSNSSTAVEASASNTNSVTAGLQACATNKNQYYQASSATDINTALQSMLASALNSPGRLSF